MCDNQSKPFPIHFAGSNNLLIVGGYDSNADQVSDAQIVDLSSQTRSCNNFPDYPIAVHSATGAIVSKQPMICGGFSENTHSECYKYSKGTSINDVRFFWGGSSKIGQNWTRGVGSLSKIGHSIILVLSQRKIEICYHNFSLKI